MSERRSATVRTSRQVGAVFFLVTALLLSVAGAFRASTVRAQDTNDNPDATVRVIHASPGAPAVDVLIDGQPLVTNLAFGTATDYAPVKEGKYKIQIVPTGQDAESAVVEQDVSFDSGQAYIIAAENPLNDIKAEVYQVNLDAVDAGKARARVIHASPDAGKVDVVVTGGDTLFGGVSSGDTTDYKDIDAGAYNIDIRGDNDAVLFSAADLAIKAGRVYDIFAIGQIADKTFALVPLETNVSRPCGEVLGLADATSEDACLRVVHASPGSPAVDVYLNGSSVVSNLAFGTATDYVLVPTGDKNKVQVTATGASVDNAVIDKDYDLDAGQAYQIVATGPLDDIQATDSEVDLTPLPEGQARIRVIHASPDAGKVDVKVKDADDNLFGDVSFRDSTDYKVVDAGDYVLQIRKAGEDTVALEVDATLEAGTVYDVIAIGRADDKSMAVLVLTSQASVREGGISTPEAAGTPVEAGTVTSAADDSGTPAPLTETKEAGAETPTPAS